MAIYRDIISDPQPTDAAERPRSSTVHSLQIDRDRKRAQPLWGRLRIHRQLDPFPRDVLFGDAAEGSCGVRQNSVADLAGLFAGYVGTRTVSMAADRLVARIKCRTREFCKSG